MLRVGGGVSYSKILFSYDVVLATMRLIIILFTLSYITLNCPMFVISCKKDLTLLYLSLHTASSGNASDLCL